jgi:hypothetical protein
MLPAGVLDFTRLDSGRRRTVSTMTTSQRVFQIHATLWASVNAFLVVVWLLTGAGYPWFLFPALGWGIPLALHATLAFGRPFAHADDELTDGDHHLSLGG